MTSHPKLLVILGSTSTGKTDLALSFAKKLNSELISCDSRQVYRGLDIGTGKMPDLLKIEKGDGWWNIDGVRIWMYDVIDPKRQYTVFNYIKDVNQVIDDILIREKLPIIVGGTGFYLKALLEGLPNLIVPMDENLRKRLEKLSKEELQEKLQQISPNKWETLNKSDRQNPRRLVRVIEIMLVKPKQTRFKLDLRFKNFNILKIGLTALRNILYQRIDERVINRMNQGMIDEVKRLQSGGLSIKRMGQLGLEYGVLADYLERKINSEEELIRIMQGKIHGYARRQITWFKKEQHVRWFNITDKDYLQKVEKLIIKWYDNRVRGFNNDTKN